MANEMKVGNMKGVGFYIRAAKLFFDGIEAKVAADGQPAVEVKAPAEELKISSLGKAINVVSAVAAKLEADSIASIVNIETGYPEINGGRSCPRIIISMRRSTKTTVVSLNGEAVIPRVEGDPHEQVNSTANTFRKICDLHAQIEKDSVAPDDTTGDRGEVIRSAAESRRLEMTHRLFGESGNPDLWNYMPLIRAAVRERNVGKALSLLQHLEQQNSVDTTAYNCVLDMCVECGDHNAAQDLLKRMKQNSLVDVISFNIILKSILRFGSSDDVENVLKDMRCKGFYPTKVTYNSLMNAAIPNGAMGKTNMTPISVETAA